MIVSAKLHKEFWAELREEKPDLKKLNAVGAQITETGNVVTENYKEIVKISGSACEVLYSYAHYLIFVNEDYAEGKELLSNARKIFQDKQLENKHDEEKWEQNESLDKRNAPAIIVQYASRSGVPRILNSNLLFTEVSGYSKGELYDC
jgi:predicted metallo-beta-lactamase superfamily hydrolase